MPCVGSSLFISFAGSRFSVASLSWSVNIGFAHACLSLRVVTGSNSVPNFSEIIRLILWFRCWRQNAAGIWCQSWYNERSTDLSTVQIIVFPFWVNRRVSPFFANMNIRVFSKTHEATESLAFHRAIALFGTDRDHEQKLVLIRLFALPPVAESRFWGFRPPQSIHCIWVQISFRSIVHWSSRIHNKHTIFCVSGAFTRE